MIPKFSLNRDLERFWTKFTECTKCFRYDPEVLVNRDVHCPWWENKPSLNSVHIVGECSSVAFEQNPVQDTLAALFVQSHACRMKSTFDFEMS